MILYFILLNLSKAMETSNCRNFTCESNSTNMDCVVANATIVNIYQCTPGYACPTIIFNNSDPLIDTVCILLNRNSTCTGTGMLTGGRVCCTSSDCNSNNCYNGICTQLDPCVANEDCAFNEYCSSGSCVSCSPEGSSCSNDATCIAGYGCNNGICTQLLSLDIGSAANS